MDPGLDIALRSLNGLARRAELLRAGAPADSFGPAWAAGEILRVRHGVYARPGLPEPILRAARIGGVLAAASAAPFLGLWKPPHERLFASVRPGAMGLRDPDDATRALDRMRDDVVVLHDGGRLRPGARLHVDVRTCVRQTVQLESPAFALAILNSALRAGRLDADDLAWLTTSAPVRCHPVLAAADRRAESGTESVMMWNLRCAGIAFEPQVVVDGGERVDFVVGRRVAVECVSVEHHAGTANYSKDRRRIASIVRQGYVVLEFTYDQVLYDWPMVIATIRAAIEREYLANAL
ncbi:very-short-patch-repair endonuclease [Frondihabitans sp. PhB188]|uniref:type IV toxin-antitoxin system AbiEi family antitoxin domain-containing protein n=1 Tax=Frondihabitans sp. PhB188 TaxID=2485200 RepID=UPI000F4988C8|nr:type IV toxin-antitoxin system AbiEi family antitoxin domain-containing protein [Frondihabitans sp. PhB188]ROQ37373.1 very-short-patch-repair endonuclease [Frondihabitans sp. PhB188]